MTTETDVTRFVATKDVVTHHKTLKKATEESDDYEWMRAGTYAHVCKHSDNVYMIVVKMSEDVVHVIGCSCKAWTFAHDNDGCKHVYEFLKRVAPPQKLITDEIAKDLMTAGWTGGRGNLSPPDDSDHAVKPLPDLPSEHPSDCENVPEPKEEPKMEEETKKIYTHPDGTEFESAEALLDYAEKQKATQTTTQSQSTFKLAPMIKGIQPQMRERGRITIGKKGSPNASGKGRMPVKFDHFVFTTTDKDEKTDDYLLDTEMNERYGDQCREIPVRFLSDDITEIFATFYAKYTASGLKLRGDGANWIVYNSDGTRDYIRDPDGERGFLSDPDVKPHGILTMLVDGQGSVGSVYRYRTTGWNSINGMLSSLALCAKIAERAGGRIAFLPMKLTYSTKWVTPAGQGTKKKIPVVTCEFRGSIEELQERSMESMKYLSAPNNTEDGMQLTSANIYDADDETLEEQQDIAAEFAPRVE